MQTELKSEKQPNWSKGQQGLLPAIIQDAKNSQVLMLGYMNEESLQRTLQTKNVVFFSRSRNELWLKGETSGHRLLVQKLFLDCDQDTILIQALPTGPVCHTGSTTCFGETQTIEPFGFLGSLSETIEERKTQLQNLESKSYTTQLFRSGLNRIAQKVGEEAVETVIAAIGGESQSSFKEEAADLLFHLMVLLAAKNESLASITEVLHSRSAKN